MLRAALLAGALGFSFADADFSRAMADDFTGLGTLGGTNSYMDFAGVSADGLVVAGYSDVAGNTANHAFRWSGGVMTDLGTLGGTQSLGMGISGDGSVVVGFSHVAGDAAEHAFRWTGNVMSDLGTLGGTQSNAFGVSADSLVVVGRSHIAADAAVHAFRWAGNVMSDLNTLGGTHSAAFGASADGSVVIGESDIAGDTASHAFRWTGNVMSDLGTLGGNDSIAYSVSADGSVVVGMSRDSGNQERAFRWAGNIMTSLGTLGGSSSRAYGVSGDGLVVVGSSTTTNNAALHAFRWTSANGMQSIPDLLTTSGVNITGWALYEAKGASFDGSVIVGNGTNPSGNSEVWLARFGSQYGAGLITVNAAAQSFAGNAAMGTTGNAYIGSTLGTMTELALQNIDPGINKNTPYLVFAYGHYDTDPTASGTLGLTRDFGDNVVAGVTLGAAHVRTNMVYDGAAKMNGGALGAFVTRSRLPGLQWTVAASATTLKGTVDRGYLNGSGLAQSSGSTSAFGYGATARVGYAFDASRTRG